MCDPFGGLREQEAGTREATRCQFDPGAFWTRGGDTFEPCSVQTAEHRQGEMECTK